MFDYEPESKHGYVQRCHLTESGRPRRGSMSCVAHDSLLMVGLSERVERGSACWTRIVQLVVCSLSCAAALIEFKPYTSRENGMRVCKCDRSQNRALPRRYGKTSWYGCITDFHCQQTVIDKPVSTSLQPVRASLAAVPAPHGINRWIGHS